MKKISTIIITLVIVLNLKLPVLAQYTVLHQFTGVPLEGSGPMGKLVFDGTYLYGMTSAGGWLSNGTVFRIKPDGTGDTMLLDMADGRNPHGSLFYDGTFLYGLTNMGGLTNQGILFKMLPDGTGYVKLLDFAGVSTGSNPYGTLISDGTFLYGTTYQGGTSNKGVIFKIMPDGTGFSKLHDFTGLSDGKYPEGDLFYDGTFLYGTVNENGIFKIMPGGTGFTTILSFNTILGTHPYGSLISDGTYLYGMTSECGSSAAGKGVVFKMMPDGSGYAILHYFDNSTISNGHTPYGSLYYDGTYLYGMTNAGGIGAGGSACIDGCGVLFRIKTDGTGYFRLYDFDSGVFGSSPWGDIISDGASLYGMTSSDYVHHKGVVFKFALVTTDVAQNSDESDFEILPNPTTGVFTIETTTNKIESIKIINVLGEEVIRNYELGIRNEKSVTIDMSGVAKGIYFVRVEDEKRNVVNRKIIVQ